MKNKFAILNKLVYICKQKEVIMRRLIIALAVVGLFACKKERFYEVRYVVEKYGATCDPGDADYVEIQYNSPGFSSVNASSSQDTWEYTFTESSKDDGHLFCKISAIGVNCVRADVYIYVNGELMAFDKGDDCDTSYTTSGYDTTDVKIYGCEASAEFQAKIDGRKMVPVGI